MSVPRKVDEHEVWPGAPEAIDGALSAVDGPVVDDPEHPLRRRVGLAGHHVGDEVVKRVVANRGFAAAKQAASRVVDVDRREVGQCAAPAVLVLDYPEATG